jgi:hypothetical protein
MTTHALDMAPKIGHGLALAILIAIGVVCYRSTAELIQVDESIAHTRELGPYWLVLNEAPLPPEG